MKKNTPFTSKEVADIRSGLFNLATSSFIDDVVSLHDYEILMKAYNVVSWLEDEVRLKEKESESNSRHINL